MPPELHNERDWALFQAALNRSALILIGSASHAATPNRKGRRRLIISQRAPGLEAREDGHWLNPSAIPLQAALDAILPEGGEVAVVGGQAVFDLVGASGLTAFQLARARRVRLPDGRGLFRACEEGAPSEEILARGGLVSEGENVLDPEADVTLAMWRRPG
jgi:hypothetical protein